MKKTKHMPLWVFLAFSSIETRKMAMILIWSCILFTVYCIPFSLYTDSALIKKLFLINDWSWAAIMLPMCLWYWLSLRWVDKHASWPDYTKKEQPAD